MNAKVAIDKKALDATLLWLCSVHSPIGEEKALCDLVQARVESWKLPSPVRRYGDSIVVAARRAKQASHANPANQPRPWHVALVGHLDTVRTENGPARIDGDRCFGSGSSDMKSGLAVMLLLVETLAALPELAFDLTLVFYAREEGPFAENELGPVLAEDPELSKVDLAVCLEPSDNKLHLGCCGSIHALLSFAGRTGHSARPWEADNPLFHAAAFLQELAKLAPEETTIDGMTYRSVFTPTQTRDAGRGRNVVPDRFSINLNHRFAPRYTVEQAQENVRKLVGDRAAIEWLDLSPAAVPSASHPLVQALIATGVAGVAPKQAWTDVARFAAAGVAAINFGPGENAQAHQRNESTSLALVHEGAEIFLRWLTSLPPRS